jgi:beta-N-acetylhexosaminidase
VDSRPARRALGPAAALLALAPALWADAGLLARAEELRASLDLPSTAAQVLLIGIEGRGWPSAGSLELVESLGPGGVVLFSFNLPEAAADLALYTASLQSASAKKRPGIPLIVALDHEGGAVFRFKNGGVTRLPPPGEVGSRGPDYAALLGKAAGEELRALGVNTALAPVVELMTDANARFLGNRSYGRDAERVDSIAGAFIGALQSAGVSAVAKHFPGNATEDPHRSLPRLGVDAASYERDYLPRFGAAVARGVGAIMLSHVLLPALDPERPASLSPLIVEGELRERLGFEGPVLTDDLFMGALSSTSSPEKTAVQALAAGADLLMLSAGTSAPRIRDAIVRAVEAGRLDRSRLDEAARRVIALKLRFAMGEGLGGAEERRSAFPALVDRHAREISAYLARPGAKGWGTK